MKTETKTQRRYCSCKNPDAPHLKGNCLSQQHTPLRWITIQNGEIHLEYDKGGIYDGTVAINVISEDEAERIVRAVNSHERLLGLAKDALAVLIRDNSHEGNLAYQLRSAIAQAEGGK